MSLIWNNCKRLHEAVTVSISSAGNEINEPHMEKFNHSGWSNRVWSGSGFRRAHIDVVDATDTKRLWMMHVCIMPHLHNSGPIYGLDIVAGERKVTGFFLDYSMSAAPNDLDDYYVSSLENTQWNKQRELPEWAKMIFSEHMVAAGNIQDDREMNMLMDLATSTLDYYLKNIASLNNTIDAETGKQIQNSYAYYQKQNPHTPRVMKNLGLDEKLVEQFCSECLFPELT